MFIAINESARRLCQLHIDLLGVRTPSPQQTKALWPNPTADPPEYTRRPLKLEFFSKVNRPNRTELSFIYSDNERHAMYLAWMQTGTSNQVVFVKFATRYREYVHRVHVGVVGDICMVIVEYSQRRGTSRSSSDLAPWFMAHFYRD